MVSADVLIPRPESETIIELLKYQPRPPQRIVDVGTGSGALGITAKLELPKASVILSDISLSALHQAEANATALGATVTFVQSNLLEAIPKIDCIIANLPYVDKTWQRSPETRFEPPTALFAPQGGLELINQLIIQASSQLTTGGFLYLEADPRQFTQIEQFASQYNFILSTRKGFVLQFTKG